MASLYLSQDSRNLLIAPPAILRAFFSEVMTVHPRRDSPTRDPTTSTSGSRLSTSSTGFVNPLTSPMRPTHDHIFLELLSLFRRGKPPLENDNTSIYLRNHSGSSLIRLLPVSAPWLKAPSTWRLSSVCSEKRSLHSRMITQASTSRQTFRFILIGQLHPEGLSSIRQPPLLRLFPSG